MVAVVFALALFVAAPAITQSFDCKKAQTRVELIVCADRTLAELDEHLGRYYSAARGAVRGAEACVQANQREWLKSSRDGCQDAACLKAAYLARLAELDPLQPGATAIKNINLPATPSLVWIVPPASDRLAAPPNLQAPPFEAVGSLVDDIATNANAEGLVLRTKDGTRVPIVMLMFLEEPTQTQLALLAKQPGATYRARGYAATDSRGLRFFEPSRCVFLHRLP